MDKFLTFTNSQLFNFSSWLSKLELLGKDSRVRTRFLKMVKDRLIEIETTRVEIAQKYAKKDDKGKYEMVNDQYQFEPLNFVGFLNEYGAVLKETFVIDVLEGNRETLETIKKITLETDNKFSEDDAFWYDEVCEILE